METDDSEYVGQSNNCIEGSQSAVNNLIIDYYKKFGRKRDLEQFFSLSTAQCDIRDPTSLFWRKMKSQTDSSDSGEKKSESSTELCRISIKCSIPEPSSSQDDYKKHKSDSESPPIIREELGPEASRISDNESIKSEDVYSHKSVDGTLDTSANKPHSPTSSITSQRKLEWDSLADVGYANASDRKNSASSLSTIERMALQQQFSINDTKQDSDLGMPTAQSTPLDVNENKTKNKKGCSKKTTKIYNRDVESVNLNISQNAENNRQPINLNLTKHISFNVEKDGGVSIENIAKSVSLSPEKVSTKTETTPQATKDQEIQTSLNKNKQKSSSSSDFKDQHAKTIPVLISLNTLKKKTRKKKVLRMKRQQRRKSLAIEKKYVPFEKSTEQLSAAESFEYMPGHIYNQNQINEFNKNNNDYGNKSSLESSAGLTTDSSKTIKYSFTKDLEAGIDILKKALEHRFEDSKLKKKLIKEVVQRLVKTKYKDDDSSTEFLSGLSFDSKKDDLHDITRTTSTSDGNNTTTKNKTQPKKSILRMDKFNASAIASTSQSAPNLPQLSKIETPICTKQATDLSNTDSDISSKNKNLSDTGTDKTPSEVLYKKYLDALKREENYRKHLKDKEIFLKQKLVSSDLAFNIVTQAERRKNNLKDLMNDLVRNNYDDGSGDASKLEGGSNSNINLESNHSLRKQRSHSVFTLSSGNSDNHMKRSSDNKTAQNKVDSSKNCYHKSEKHYCCCPYHTPHPRIGVIDSAVQVNIKTKDDVCPDSKATQSSPQGYNEEVEPEVSQHKCDKCERHQIKTHIVSDCANEEIKYFCVCAGDEGAQKVPENILIYKCSRLNNKYLNLGDNLTPKVSNVASEQFSSNSTSPRLKLSTFNSDDCEKKCLIIKDNISLNNQTSKSSQTNLNLPIKLGSKSSEQSFGSSSSGEKVKQLDNIKTMTDPFNGRITKYIHEATRCIQTEISIDPKISDPSLSDINIVNDKNCVELISEKYKEISQPSSKSNIEKRPEIRNSSTSAESNAIYEKDSSKCVCINAKEQSTNTVEKYDKEIQSSTDIDNQRPQRLDKQSPNNFTIPIQGTNMTLKVSLGSGKDDKLSTKNTLQNDFKCNTKFECVGTETDKNNIVENYTSLREECSKGVQSNNANIFDEFYQQTKTTCCENGENENTPPENIGVDTQENTRSFAKPFYLNSCLTDRRKYNTFPTNDKRNVQKPLLRSNTDTGKMERSCHVTFTPINNQNLKDLEVQPSIAPMCQMQSKSISTVDCGDQTQVVCSEKTSLKSIETKNSKSSSKTDGTLLKSSNSDTDNDTKSSSSKDPLLDIIQDITRRYSKKDIEKTKRKKCFRDIITFLNYLLDTEENTDQDRQKTSSSSTCESGDKFLANESYQSSPRKTFVDKGIQLSTEKSKSYRTCTNSSDSPVSTEIPSTSSDSATCKILNKIKKECEKYHQKRCKSHGKDNKCEASSSTSANCEQCRRVHHCSCKGHKCRNHKARKSGEKKKKCVAYNLIIQTSDSVVSEDVACESNRHKLQNIIVKVPSKRKVGNLPFKEVSAKIEKDMPHCSPRSKNYRSRSLPNDSEISSTDEFLRKANAYTVREYLERNRPDFVEKCSNRQHCLKLINETRPSECDKPRLNMIVVHNPPCTPSPCTEACNMCYKGIPINNCNPCIDPYMHCVQNEVTRIANERSAKRQLLSLQLDRAQALSGLSETELKNFAKVLGHELRRKKVAPKFISEREMKKHSEKIYKSLPEVVHKKEEIKKENIKKTNLLMANIFKKNLQKKTLQGAVNLSNYSTVIKI